jgi:hypothetical protein
LPDFGRRVIAKQRRIDQKEPEKKNGGPKAAVSH